MVLDSTRQPPRNLMMMKALLTFCTLLGLTVGTSAQAELTYERYTLDKNQAFLLAPEASAKTDLGKPWVWYAPTFTKRHPNKTEHWMFERLHAKGIAIAGIQVGESMGNPEGRAAFQQLYEHMVEKGYSTKPGAARAQPRRADALQLGRRTP